MNAREIQFTYARSLENIETHTPDVWGIYGVLPVESEVLRPVLLRTSTGISSCKKLKSSYVSHRLCHTLLMS